MTIRIESAAGLSLPALTELFNAGYAGYIVPVGVNEAYLRNHIQQFDISLEHSAVALDDERPVGFAFLGIRGTRGWVAGVGVATEYRQQGVGRRVMLALLDNARAAGLTSVQLEVIVGNDKAHVLYQKIGMQDTGRVLVLERKPAPVEAVAWAGALADGDVQTALAAFDALHTRANVWQREPQSIRQAGTPPQVRLALRDGALLAYALGTFNSERISMLDLGVDPAQPDALAALMAGLHDAYPLAVGRLVNVNDDDPAVAVLEGLGYSAPLAQDTMRIEL